MKKYIHCYYKIIKNNLLQDPDKQSIKNISSEEMKSNIPVDFISPTKILFISLKNSVDQNKENPTTEGYTLRIFDILEGTLKDIDSSPYFFLTEGINTNPHSNSLDYFENPLLPPEKYKAT